MLVELPQNANHSTAFRVEQAGKFKSTSVLNSGIDVLG